MSKPITERIKKLVTGARNSLAYWKEMAALSQADLDAAKGELTRLQSRLAECEKERDELRTQLDAWHCQFGTTQLSHAVADHERLVATAQNAHAKKSEVESDLTALRALVAKKDEALKTCLEMFREIRGDWTDPRMECRAGADAAVAALALTPSSLHGMAVVPVGELEELRRDKEIVDFLAARWNSQGSGQQVMGRRIPNVSGSFRDAIAARSAGEAP
jgi:hypothetical protein